MSSAPSPPQDVREALKRIESNLNSIRDCMIEDRGHYEGLLQFALEIEVVADWCRETLAALAQSDAEPGPEPVTFWYKNYRDQISRRVATPLGMRWGSSEYHKEPQWLLRAFDLEKEAEREFAVKDMAPTREALPDAQSDAEPVAWQYRWRINEGSPWTKWTECDKNYSVAHATTEDMEFRSLYTAIVW